ncbi:MAG: MOSC domain-containing protein, partial [bacterium]|nr:MOSC domain-containing protein [bacterium]
PQFEGIDGKPQAQFYDVAPVLVGNQASLDDFNTRTHEPVPMDRFRVNVVVGGDLEPYGEDQLSSLTSDDIELRHVNVCERCILTTTDQTTGERPTQEPIKTLSTYRRIEDGKYASGVVFGLYMTPREDGVLRVGDALDIAHFA